MTKKHNREDCPKSDRCKFGGKCPHEYEPSDIWYGCYKRGKPITKLKDCTRADLLEVIKFASDYDPAAKAAIEKGLCYIGYDPEPVKYKPAPAEPEEYDFVFDDECFNEGDEYGEGW